MTLFIQIAKCQYCYAKLNVTGYTVYCSIET